MSMSQPSRFDPSYHLRYTQRNKKKTKAILEAVGSIDTLLDIGCNQGYVTKAFFDNQLLNKASGIEMDASVVDKELLADSRFSLFEGNVLDFQFKQPYDVVIFNSVFHHVFGTYGKDTALGLWDRIVDHCDQTIIFETGIFTEFGQYYWKDEFEKYYSNDDVILDILLNRIGSRLKKCEEVTSLPIHWTKRPVYKIELYPIGSEFDLKQSEVKYYADYYLPEKKWEILHKYRRTDGSNNQELVEITPSTSENEFLYSEAEFFLLSSLENKKLAFGKKILNDPYKKMREFFILKSVTHPHVVSLLNIHPDYGFIFKYYNWQSLEKLGFKNIKNISWFADELKTFFHWATQEKLSPNFLDIDPSARGTYHSLIDMIDIHQNNILVKVEDEKIQDWVVIDLQYLSNNYLKRNRQNLHKILSLLGTSDLSFLVSKVHFFFQSVIRYTYRKLQAIFHYITLINIYIFIRKAFFLILKVFIKKQRPSMK